jgi:hypothetical protein
VHLRGGHPHSPRPNAEAAEAAEDRLRRIENDGDALCQVRDRLRVKVDDLVAERTRLKSVAGSETQEVDDLRGELARLGGELRPRNRERDPSDSRRLGGCER